MKVERPDSDLSRMRLASDENDALDAMRLLWMVSEESSEIGQRRQGEISQPLFSQRRGECFGRGGFLRNRGWR